MDIVYKKVDEIIPYEKNLRIIDAAVEGGRPLHQGVRLQRFFLILTRRESTLWTPLPVSRK